VALGAPAQLKAEHGAGNDVTLEDVFIKLIGRRFERAFEE